MHYIIVVHCTQVKTAPPPETEIDMIITSGLVVAALGEGLCIFMLYTPITTKYDLSTGVIVLHVR